jgi:glycosyltransferase involved in cell wall biosynthesis
MKNIKILYLYAEVMGYTIATIRELANLGIELHIVSWDKKKITPYVYPNIENVTFYKRSDHNYNSISEIARNINPNLIVISGWQDYTYLRVVKKIKRNGIPIVSGFDSQFLGTFKQNISIIIGRIYKKYFFTHGWVAGPLQFEYAKKLRFKTNEIIFNLYSADLDIFNNSFNVSINKNLSLTKKFIFVGRFENIKGIKLLIDAWEKLGKNKNDWTLQFIGNGTYKDYLKNRTDIIVTDFVQPYQLNEIISTAGCFVLPSLYEPWGVVIHEFAAAGLPLICSDKCGAASEFLINGYNGFLFKSGSIVSLSKQMLKIINLQNIDLYKMSIGSNILAQRISPTISAKSLLSILST